jgi:tRNA pseudouridine55 synthase
MMQIDIQKGSVILINKPLEWTSFDVVNKLRYAIIKYLRQHSPELFEGKKYRPKVGHAGTLDPLATGLLIVCAGKETKNIDKYMGQEKEYTGSIFLGATRPSYDKETEINQQFETAHITEELIQKTTEQFIGEIEQVPPVFSAIKKDGKKAYQSAREGEEIKMDARTVSIKEFEITKIEMPLVHFRIVCSKGTYIRSIAYDFGKALGSGGYLDSLCRTRIGEFILEDAMNVEDFINSLQD